MQGDDRLYIEMNGEYVGFDGWTWVQRTRSDNERRIMVWTFIAK